MTKSLRARLADYFYAWAFLTFWVPFSQAAPINGLPRAVFLACAFIKKHGGSFRPIVTGALLANENPHAWHVHYKFNVVASLQAQVRPSLPDKVGLPIPADRGRAQDQFAGLCQFRSHPPRRSDWCTPRYLRASCRCKSGPYRLHILHKLAASF